MSRLYQLCENHGFYIEKDLGDFFLGFHRDDGSQSRIVISQSSYDALYEDWTQ